MKCFRIPFRFEVPTRADVERYFEAMGRCQRSPVWPHCAANLRGTACLGLHRRLRQGGPHEEAIRLMRDVWEPNAVWATFIAAQLAGEDAV